MEPDDDDFGLPSPLDLTGKVLGDRYEVVRRLGVGGMSEVYEGRRVGLLHRVALKVLKPELAIDPSNVKRFLREARAASVIEHENVVEILDFGAVDQTPVYFVMEFLEGEDLRQRIRRRKVLPWSEAREILLPTAAALAAAHARGVVHRDVKPANIYLARRSDGSEQVKVLDFGIAKVFDEAQGLTRGLTKTNGILGTVAYMAPEQAYSAPVDPRTDVYALGCVLYQMLTGTVPFSGGNPFMVLGRHVNEPPRPPRDLVSSIPPAVEAIVLRCMAKDPGDRFASMDDLRDAVLALGSVADAENAPVPRYVPASGPAPGTIKRPFGVPPPPRGPIAWSTGGDTEPSPDAQPPPSSTPTAPGRGGSGPSRTDNWQPTEALPADARIRRRSGRGLVAAGLAVGAVAVIGTATWATLEIRKQPADASPSSSAPAAPAAPEPTTPPPAETKSAEPAPAPPVPTPQTEPPAPKEEVVEPEAPTPPPEPTRPRRARRKQSRRPTPQEPVTKQEPTTKETNTPDTKSSDGYTTPPGLRNPYGSG